MRGANSAGELATVCDREQIQRYESSVPPVFRRLLDLALLFSLMVALLVVYAKVLLNFWNPLLLDGLVLLHLLLNAGCNCIVVACSFRINGDLDRRVARVLLVALSVHAAFWILLLTAGWYFSGSVLFSTLLVSMSLGVFTTIMAYRYKPRRIGVVMPGSSPELLGWIGGPFEPINDPAVDVRLYDLLVVNLAKAVNLGWGELISHAMLAGCEVRHLPEYVEKKRGRVSIDDFRPDQVAPAGAYPVLKRGSDIMLVIASLPIVLPLTAIIAVVVLATMGRPVLFVQNRVGWGGATFRMLKFRTMRNGVSGPATTEVNDKRVTATGRILRRFRLDELPQLWNILRGDMSIVGPRPEEVGLASRYTAGIPAFPFRHVVRPGLTGWAQVRFGYSSNMAEAREKLTYDLYYAKYFSFALDTQIIARTLITLLRRSSVR